MLFTVFPQRLTPAGRGSSHRDVRLSSRPRRNWTALGLVPWVELPRSVWLQLDPQLRTRAKMVAGLWPVLLVLALILALTLRRGLLQNTTGKDFPSGIVFPGMSACVGSMPPELKLVGRQLTMQPSSTPERSIFCV